MRQVFIAWLILLFPLNVYAVSTSFVDIHRVFVKPAKSVRVMPYSVNLLSQTRPIQKQEIRYLTELNTDLIYVTRILLKKKMYYRLVMGNFANQKQATNQLRRIKEYYKGAWVHLRSDDEKSKLTQFLEKSGVSKKKTAKGIPTTKPKVRKKTISAVNAEFAKKVLEQARQLFLDSKYNRVITNTNKVIETGTIEQKQQAMELAGVARERQNKFAQAIVIYNEFLDLYPDSELAPKIRNRITGLQTMRKDPKKPIAKTRLKRQDDRWNIYGSLSQYYRDDVLERDSMPSEKINSALITDVNLFARQKSENSSLGIRFDAGLVNDLLEDGTEPRISRAMVDYTNNESGYQLRGGRQSRTVKGVLGRFDGFVYTGLSNPNFNYSIFTGFPVQSSFDAVETDRQFLGTSINFQPFDKFDMDVYLLQQEVSKITDRQAIGTEFQYRANKGFLYGIIDYDFFYEDLNNITAISNYRVDERLSFNITYDFRNTPILTTLNALQGQAVASIDELLDIYTAEEIYQFAEDRTSKGHNLFAGSSYQIDDKHQLYFSLSLSSIEETVSSGGVDAIPATDDINIAADYTIRGYFLPLDYTTFGFRLSDSSSSEVVSLRLRTRFSGSKGWRYDPRLRLDYRKSKNTSVNQWIFKPTFKLTYKPTVKLTLELILGIEYSNYDLPELGDHVTNSIFVGYIYQF